jgi:two-component system NarL family response regulator
MPTRKKEQQHVITIAILEDNIPTLTGLRMELDKPDIRIVAAHDELKPFFEAVKQNQPEVAIVDMRVQSSDTEGGHEAIRVINEVSPQTRIIIYTAFDSLEHFHFGINQGVKAFVSKNIHEVPLEKVIRIVLEGGTYYGKFMQQYLDKIKEMPQQAELGALPAASQCPLSDRELEVLKLFGEGKSEEEMAAALFVSENTIKAHTKNIRGKLNVKSTREALRLARIRGWL